MKSHGGEQLLWALSTRSELNWQQYKEIIDVIRTDKISDSGDFVRSVVAHFLDALGHAEFIREASGLSLRPCVPSLLRLATSDPIAVLSGARTPRTIDKVIKAGADSGCEVEIGDQPGNIGLLLPHIVSAKATRDEHLQQLALATNLWYSADPPANSIAAFAPTVDDIAAALEWKNSPELNWDRSEFDAVEAHFVRARTSSALRLVRYLDPTKGVFRYEVRRDDMGAAVDSDWGRYLVLRELEQNVIYFNKSENTFLHPRTVPLPKFIARALVLCSGRAPSETTFGTFRSGKRYWSYPTVPLQIASIAALKLGQEIRFL